MSNSYSQMAIMLTGNLDELKWLEMLIDALANGTEGMPEDIADIVSILDGNDNCVGVHTALLNTTGGPVLHIYADESFNPDGLAFTLQAWLGRFKSDVYVTFTWANTSSSTNPGEFGGGACIVGRYSTEWMNTDMWAVDMQRAMQSNVFVRSGHNAQDKLSKAAHDLFHTPDTVEVEGRYTCRHCGREWSAMCGDGDVPELCPSDDCPGNIAREVLRVNMRKEV